MDGYTSGYIKDLVVRRANCSSWATTAEQHRQPDPSVGFVRISDVYGKAVFRLYPFSEIGPLN
jgi:hypothetical protein